MKLSEYIWHYRRLSWLIAFAFTFMGILAWINIPKEEDPRLKERFGVIKAIYPGASPSSVQAKIIAPLLDELKEISEIKKTRTEARYQFALVKIDLHDYLSDTGKINSVWDDVRRAIDRAREDWPNTVQDIELNRKVLEQDAIIYALSGDETTDLERLSAAEIFEKELLQLSGVAKVNIIGDPERQISITIDSTKLEKAGLTIEGISRQLAASNLSLGGGTTDISDKKISLTTNSTFTSLEELRNFPCFQNRGTFLRLSEIATISETIKLPRQTNVYWQGKPALMIGIVPEENIDLIELGSKVTDLATTWNFPSIEVDAVSIQPEYVASRLKDLSLSLVSGMGIIAVLLVLFMGLRVGIFVAIMVPSVTLSALSLYAYSGGVMQQISIAAFVLALGLLVDNFIVIVEGVQTKLDEGCSRSTAAIETIKEFTAPLLAATGTTIATFVPLLGSVGSTADFTRSIPQVTTLTLALSYIFAVLITPTISAYFLKPSKRVNKANVITKIGSLFSFAPKKFPKLTVFLCIVALGAVIPLIPQLKLQFFPLADRDQMVVNLELPAGTNLNATTKASLKLSQAILNEPDVKSIATFVGQSVPRFFYNLNQESNRAEIAQMIVTIDDYTKSRIIRDRLEKLAEEIVPEAITVVKNLGQGPPVDADIELKIFSEDDSKLWIGEEMLRKLLSENKAARDVRSDLGLGQAILKYEISDQNALRYGLTRSQITQSIIFHSRGLPISEFKTKDKNLDIVLRSKQASENNSIDMLATYLKPTASESVYLRDVARQKFTFEPSVIKTEDSRRLIHVYAELEDGAGFNEVLLPLKKKLQTDPLPSGAYFQTGGASEESEVANQAIVKVLPLGILLLLVSMLWQFNSFRRLIIINSVVPFIVIGIVFGLWFTDQPFGFFSLLGALALIGIVVNNAILLVDYADSQVSEGKPVKVAIEGAMVRRIRPIFLTTLTTIAGLLPLSLGSTTLWPPFANVMIFGLITSSVITLFLVPALYHVFFKEKTLDKAFIEDKAKIRSRPQRLNALTKKSSLLVALSVSPALPKSLIASDAKTISLFQIVEEAKRAPRIQSAISMTEKIAIRKNLQWASSILPKVGIKAQRVFQDRSLYIEGPFGIEIPGPQKSRWQGGFAVEQPIFNYNEMIEKQKTLDYVEQSALDKLDFTKRDYAFNALIQAIQIMVLNTQLRNNDQLQSQLEERLREIERLLVLGKISKLDQAKIIIALNESRQLGLHLKATLLSLSARLGSFIGYDEPVTPDTSFADKIIEEYFRNKEKHDLFLEKKKKRPDIISLEKEVQALGQNLREIDAEVIPNLSFNASANYLDPSPYKQELWSEFTLTLSVSLWEGGTRRHRKHLIQKDLSAKRSEIKAKTQELEAQIYAEEVKINELRSRIKQEKANFELTKAAVESERLRFQNGRTDLDQVLEGEFLLRDKRLAYELATLKTLVSFFRSRHLKGLELIDWEDN